MISYREIKNVLKEFNEDIEAIAEELVKERESVHDLQIQVPELEERIKELEIEALIQTLQSEELPQYLSSEEDWIRKLAKKRYNELRKE